MYSRPAPEDPVDQGDLIDACPILQVAHFDLQAPTTPQVACSTHRVVVLTQTCDLANRKTQRAVVALVHNAQFLVSQKVLTAADVRGPIRAGRVYGWYFLPASPEHGLEEAVVDLRQLFTIPLSVLHILCASGARKGCIQALYREHLAKHFADTYSRIGLPEPYPTE